MIPHFDMIFYFPLALFDDSVFETDSGALIDGCIAYPTA